MAGIQRERNGVYTAVWRNSAGARVLMSTGETMMERAARRAAALEAVARFWEDQEAGVWQRMADAKFSPRYLHSIFTCRAHIPFPAFRKLLVEAGVAFKPPGAWIDRTRPKGRRSGKTWKHEGKMLTLDDLLEKAHASITRSALRFRLEKGWTIEKAITMPLLSRSEAGLLAHPNSQAEAA